MKHPLVLLAVVSLVLNGCRCGSQVQQVERGRLVVTPQRLSLGAVYVDQVVTGVVSATNEGGAPIEADVVVDSPFTVETPSLRLVRGESIELTVSFAPSRPGLVSGVLLVGELQVQVEAEGLEVPACVATTVCSEARFDVAGAQCSESPKANGVVCETSCVTGACSSGTCLGQLKGCDDGNACTVDACDEKAGCSRSPRVCPQPTTPCRVARCDVARGCATEEAPDGTLCGPDDCLATQVDVCISGSCVTRVRPDSGRCANRWVPTSIPARGGGAMTYDAARQRVVLFGGFGGLARLSDTWEWDGATWTQRTPVASPPGRNWHAMAYDAARQRVVVFGGGNRMSLASDDTWEWDGATWTQRTPAASPPARSGHALVYDSARQRVVLFGGRNLSDTWEWDGTTWTQRRLAASPSARSGHTMAYDPVRQRVVLFGGAHDIGTSSSFLSDTWEWDGATWTQQNSAGSPPARRESAMAYDAARQRIVLFGGASSSSRFSDTWEWDGATWTQRTPAASPPARSGHALAYDSARQRVVLFGGEASFPMSGNLSDTWEWDGATWTERNHVASPRAQGVPLVYDGARQRIIVFGGFGNGNAGGNTSETWEWDGAAWTRRYPANSPRESCYDYNLAYDAARQRVVYVGRSQTNNTWEWDGTTWTQRNPADPPSGQGALAYDVARQRLTFFNGTDTWVLLP